MEARLKLGAFLKRIPLLSYISKANNNHFMTNFMKKIYFNRTKISYSLMTGIFLTFYKKNNKLFCIDENNTNEKAQDLEKKVKVIQHNANTPCEDRYIALKLKNLDGDFLAVFDGHGGDSVSQFASEKMAKYFDSIYLELTNKNNKGIKSQEEIIKQAFLDTFHKIENELLENAKKLYNKGEGRKACVGSCALAILVTNDKLYVAQLGDSKAKIYKKIEKRILSQKLSRTFNCEKPHQQLHLFKNFNDVDIVVCKRDLNKVCYVKGRLQPTRSFGDFHLKSIFFNRGKKDDPNFKAPIIPFNGPYISAVPDIKIYNREKNDWGMILATDGFWDNFSSDEVAKLLEQNQKFDNEKLINLILKESLGKAASSCNMSLANLLNLPDESKRKTYDDTTIIFYKF